jgi:hypothetical protein
MPLLASLVCAFALRVPVQAQGETTSAIAGSVTDPAGAAIPGATVTLTSVENGLKRSVKRQMTPGGLAFRNLSPARTQ